MLRMSYILCMSSRNFLSSGNVLHFCLDFHVHCWVVFQHMVFSDGFPFLIKELWLLTNPVHWFRVLDAVGSYMYIVL
jgi:hypothetical protein